MLKTLRYVFLLLIVLLLPALPACNSSPSGAKTASVAVSIDVQTPSQAGRLSPFLGTVNDITSITVDVLQGSTPLITGQQLVNNNGVWSGILPNLPIGPSLTFVGHAYNASAVQIFMGTTVQTLTGQSDSVNILLAPVTNGVTQTFPRITRILLPAQILTSNTVTVGISVSASSGEALTYAATAAPAGGSFSPSSGTINLSGTTATLVLGYTAPSTAGTYTHSIRVTNSQSNWVEMNFSTVITGTASPALIAQFAPVITAIGAARNGSDVSFTAEVSDAGPLSALTYSWAFDGDLTFVNNAVNPAVLQGYDETKSGNLTLTVRNGAGGATTVSYYIAPGLLPDNIVVTHSEAAQWARTSVNAENSFSNFTNVSVASDGSVYAAGFIVGTAAHDFGNNVSTAGTYTGGNIVLVKYNRSGVAQWARTVTAGNDNSYFSCVSVASDGSIYAAGYISGIGVYDFGNNVTATGTYTGSNIVLVKYSSSGLAQWARTVTAGVRDSSFFSVSAASDGSVYAAGFIVGTAAGYTTYDFGNNVTTAVMHAVYNLLLVKYSSSGVAQWARTVQGDEESIFNSVSVASDGSVYAAGYINGTGNYLFDSLLFGGVIARGTYAGSNIVLVKYDSFGVPQWARTVTGGNSNSYFSSVSVAFDGSVYAAGGIGINGTDTHGFGNNVTAAGTSGVTNILLVKYDSSGVAQWARTVTAESSNSYFYGVSAASDGSVYAAGHIGERTVTYDFGNGITAAGAYYNGYNNVLVKYDRFGDPQWARTVTAGNGDSYFSSVSAVASDGSLYAAGAIVGSGTYNFGDNITAAGTSAGGNAVLVKYF